MKKSVHKDYLRLPGRKGGLLGPKSLWLGNDHLLLVESTGYTESYRRFYYRDIQAVVAERSAQRAFINVMLGLLILVILGVGFAVAESVSYDESDAHIVWMVFGSLAFVVALAAVIQSLLGPCCRTTIVTSVQTCRLPSIVRVRHVNRLLAELSPRIAEIQGVVDAVELARTAATITPSAAVNTTVMAKNLKSTATRRPDSGRIHALAAYALLALSACAGIKWFVPSLLALGAASVAMVGVMVLNAISLAKQAGGRVTTGLARWSWIVFVFLLGGYAAVYILGMFASVASRGGFGSMAEAVLVPPTEHVWLAALHMYFLAPPLVLSLLGVLLVLRHRRGLALRSRPPPLSPPPLTP